MPVENNQISLSLEKAHKKLDTLIFDGIPSIICNGTDILLPLQMLPVFPLYNSLSIISISYTVFFIKYFPTVLRHKCYTVLNPIFHDKERSYGTRFFLFDKSMEQICFDSYRQNHMVFAVPARLCEQLSCRLVSRFLSSF